MASVRAVPVGLVSRAEWQQLGQCGRGDTGSGFARTERIWVELASMLWFGGDQDRVSKLDGGAISPSVGS